MVTAPTEAAAFKVVTAATDAAPVAVITAATEVAAIAVVTAATEAACARVMRETPWCTFLEFIEEYKVAGTRATEACFLLLEGLALPPRRGW